MSFAANETSKTISIPVLDDALSEGTEAFTVVLSNNVNAAIGDGSGTATIMDDEQTAASCGKPVFNAGA